jgi:phosphoglycerate dehydrogenase-like enzyme
MKPLLLAGTLLASPKTCSTISILLLGMDETETYPFRVGFSADFMDGEGRLAFPDIGLSLLENQPGIEYEFMSQYKAAYSPDQLSGYDVVISLKPRVTEGSLEGVTRLCAIGRCGVGYDNVDLRACTEHDVAVYITPQGVVRPMAESIVLLVLALSHHLVRKDRLVRNGNWVESTRRLGQEPGGRVIGSIGFGNIAREAFRLLDHFGPARLLAFDPYVDVDALARRDVEFTTLDDVLRQSDYVLINCPLTPETRHLIGTRELALMKPGAYLINTARGPIIDEAALIRVLEAGRIAGAALDVFEKEPLAEDSPLLALDNVILTSHSIGWTAELFRDMGRIDCKGALAIARGQAPANVVNREVLVRPGFLRKLENYSKERKRPAI